MDAEQMEARRIMDEDYAKRMAFYEQLASEAVAPEPCSLSGLKPFKSDVMAVHPDQVAEASEHAKKNGVPTEFCRDGRPIIRSREHQQQLCRLYGYVNKNEVRSPKNV